VKVSVGAGVNIPKNSVVDGGGSLSVYAKFSKEGTSAGANASASGTVGGAGFKASGDAPVVKDGQVVNPIKNTNGEIAPIVAGEKGKGEGEGSVGKEDTTVGGTYGEGLLFGLEFGTSSQDVGELGTAVVDAFISDAKDAIQSLKFWENPSLYQQPEPPRPQ
jgi:hypothetical protein